VSKGLISVIIPTLNEQSGIKKTISSISTLLLKTKLGYDLEVIVVDGQSTDSTREIATRMGAKVIIEKRRGYGRALKSGFAASNGEIIVTIDADNTYPIEYLPRYVEELEAGNFEFITINRFSEMEKGAMSLTRRIGNKILTLLTNLLYSLDLKDSQSGMWIMRKDFVSQITLTSDDMPISEEIKIIAFKFFRSKEIDGKYHSRSGKAKLRVFGDGWKNLKFLFKFRKKINLLATSTSKQFTERRKMFFSNTRYPSRGSEP